MRGFSIVLIAAVAALAQADDRPGATNASDMKFTNAPALPSCLTMAVQTGDPMTSEFIAATRVKPGCTIPWHWHTATENLMIVSGTGHVGMRDERGATMMKTVTAGAFVSMPPRHVHQFRCEKACELFLMSDGKFDIHYVDPKGNEITPELALRSVKESAATAMK
jgi:quercetin dioxygenase-like cupin family protein